MQFSKVKRIVIICTAYFAFNLALFIGCYLILSNKFDVFSQQLQKKQIEHYFSLGMQKFFDTYSIEIKELLRDHNELAEFLYKDLDIGQATTQLKRLFETDPSIKAIRYLSDNGQSYFIVRNDTNISNLDKKVTFESSIRKDKNISITFISSTPFLSFKIPLLNEDISLGHLEVISSPWLDIFTLIKQGTGLDITLAFSRNWIEIPEEMPHSPQLVPCGNFLLFNMWEHRIMEKFCNGSGHKPLFEHAMVMPILTDSHGHMLVGLGAINQDWNIRPPFKSTILWSVFGALASSFLAFIALLTAIGMVFSRAEQKSRLQSSTIAVLADSIKKNKRSLRKTSKLLRQEIKEKKLIKAALSRHEDILESIFNGIQDGLLALDRDFTIMSANESIFGLFKVDPPIVGKKCYECFHGRTEPCSPCPVKEAIEQRSLQRIDLEIQEQDGISRWLTVYAYPIFDKEKRVTGVVEFIRDVTEKKRLERERETLERQLIQSQKLEAIGTLAGGIAHDFNNILMAISGYVELAELKGGLLNSEVRRYFELINQSVEKASGLIRQLLIFSREEPMSTNIIDLPDLLKELMHMIDQLLGKSIQIELHFSNEPHRIIGNKRRLEQVFMNLAINARDAMPQGGKITISTTIVNVTNEQCVRIPHATPGKYVKIDFVDTGAGMEPEVMERIFEPFFTTKEIGKGTGLGLSIVYSIIKDHKGWIEVDSKIGIGTKFSIFIPAHS